MPTAVTYSASGSSPRTWGCFLTSGSRGHTARVFPTHVGVFLSRAHSTRSGFGLPHARGGVSKKREEVWPKRKSSPRTWGCFSACSHPAASCAVFPTHVGVFLTWVALQDARQRLPHARGGVSVRVTAATFAMRSSPRTWGCFWLGKFDCQSQGVFPTHVGVFPLRPVRDRLRERLPHARGGVSRAPAITPPRGTSSPRTWGCFCRSSRPRSPAPVFPTHVGVFLCMGSSCGRAQRLPHARGGVSGSVALLQRIDGSSPRTWGCFQQALLKVAQAQVFPTHVGVFPPD